MGFDKTKFSKSFSSTEFVFAGVFIALLIGLAFIIHGTLSPESELQGSEDFAVEEERGSAADSIDMKGTGSMAKIRSNRSGDAEALSDRGAVLNKVPPAQALDHFIDRLSSGYVDSPELLTIIQQLPSADMPAAWAVIAEMSWSRDRENMQVALLEQWSSTDPQAALDFAAINISSARLRKSAVDAVMNTWIATNSDTAYEWYVQNREQEPLAKRMPFRELFKELYAQDPATAIEKVFALPNENERLHTFATLLLGENASQGGREQLLDLYDASANSEDREVIAKALAWNWPHTSSYDATQWLETLNDSQARDAATQVMARSWGRLAPGEALTWIEGLPRGEARSESTETVSRLWAQDDPYQFMEWLDGQPASANKEVALESGARVLRRADPVAAMNLAAQL